MRWSLRWKMPLCSFNPVVSESEIISIWTLSDLLRKRNKLETPISKKIGKTPNYIIRFTYARIAWTRL